MVTPDGHANVQGCKWFDTLIAEQVITLEHRHTVNKSLDKCIWRHLGIQIDKTTVDHEGWDVYYLHREQIRYVVSDVIHLHNLRSAQIAQAQKLGVTEALKLELELSSIVAEMKYRGAPINENKLRLWRNSQLFKADLIKKKIVPILGDINFRSPVQLKSALKEQGIEVENTQKNTISRQAYQSEDLRVRELLINVGEYRACIDANKFADTWMDTHIIDGRIHPQWWQCGTDTGRFSSSDPTLQNIPRSMRTVFGGENMCIASDYSQIEVRIAAHLAKDNHLETILKNGHDVHTQVAQNVLGLTEISKEQRILAKSMTFTLIFGGGVRTLAEYARNSGVEITMQQANSIRRSFFRSFRGLSTMVQNAYNDTSETKTLYLPSGHQRYLSGWDVKPTRDVKYSYPRLSRNWFKTCNDRFIQDVWDNPKYNSP